MAIEWGGFASAVKRGLLAVTLAILIFALWNAIQATSTATRPYVHFVLFGVALAWVTSRRGQGALSGMSERTFLGTTVSIFVLLRLIWILSFPTAPASDCLSYDRLARELSGLEPRDPAFTFMHSWGYPIVLSIVYSVFGDTLLPAKILNLAVGGATMLVFYALAKRVCAHAVARIATLIFALWPSQVMSTSALLSEHLALLFSLLTILFVVTATGEGNRRARWHVAGGVCFAIALMMRFASLVILPCCVVALFGRCNPTRPAVKGAAIVVLICASVYGAYHVGVQWIYDRSPAPSEVALLTGTNIAADGLWNEGDVQSYSARVENGSFREANRFARTIAFRRIVDSPGLFCRLVARKFVTLWQDEHYGVYLSTHSITMTSTYYSTSKSLDARVARWIVTVPRLRFFEDVGQYFYLVLLFFGAMGACVMLRYEITDEFAVLLLILLATMVLFLIAEAQSRYLYPAKPVLLLLAARGLTVFDRRAGSDAAR